MQNLNSDIKSYRQIRCVALHHLQTLNGFFCSVNHLSGDGVNANHNAKHVPAKAKLRMTLDCSRIAKKIAMMSGFLSRARDKNKNDQKNLWRKLVDYCPKTTNLKTQKQTKWIEMHQSQVKMCFLRGPLRWLTEQKNPKFPWSLQNVQRDTTNLAIKSKFNLILLVCNLVIGCSEKNRKEYPRKCF